MVRLHPLVVIGNGGSQIAVALTEYTSLGRTGDQPWYLIAVKQTVTQSSCLARHRSQVVGLKAGPSCDKHTQ